MDYTYTEEGEEDYQEVVYDQEYESDFSGDSVPEDALTDGEVSGGQNFECPGGDLQTCVDVCPGQFGAAVFGACVLSCGNRCP